MDLFLVCGEDSLWLCDAEIAAAMKLMEMKVGDDIAVRINNLLEPHQGKERVAKPERVVKFVAECTSDIQIVKG